VCQVCGDRSEHLARHIRSRHPDLYAHLIGQITDAAARFRARQEATEDPT
jgi:hypothetical protein